MSVFNVNQLITFAYSDAGVLGDDQGLQGSQLTKGLARLNMILLDLSTTNITIPYQDVKVFNLQTSQATYVFDATDGADVVSAPIVNLNYVKLLFGSVQLPIEIVTEGFFDLDNRLATFGANSVPKYVYLQKNTNTSSITFYLPPSQDFVCTVGGQFQSTELNGTELITTFPEIYREYLWKKLTNEISLGERKISMPDEYLARIDYLYKKIKSSSDVNLDAAPNPFCQTNAGRPKPIQAGGFA